MKPFAYAEFSGIGHADLPKSACDVTSDIAAQIVQTPQGES